MSKQVDIVVIGAGPVGLFTVFEAGLLGLNCVLIDNLDKPGGQCAELYPEKPIYDIPGVPHQTGQEHVNQRVDSLEKINIDSDDYWQVITSEGNTFATKNVFIAAGAGSFEARRPPNIEEPDSYLDKGVSYAVRSVDRYRDKDVFIFGGGDSALDWTLELADKTKSLSLVHRRDVK